MTKNILITGAGGYIGTRMVERYLKLGHNIIALDRFYFGDTLKDLKRKNPQIIRDDVRFFNKKLLKNVDIVIDLASISNDASGSLNPKLTSEVNFKGSVRVAALSKEMGVKKYIFASSCSVYGTGIGLLTEKSQTGPITEYARSKLAAEKKMLGISGKEFSVTILRNATVYGLSKRRMRFDLMINLMTLTAWRENKITIYGGGKQWRPLVHIDDCIDAFLNIVNETNINKIEGEIFNVGSNSQNYQVFKVAEEFRNFFPKLVIEKIKDAPEKRDYRVDFSKINKSLNFKATRTIQDGILEIKNSLAKNEITHNLKTHTLNYYSYLMEANNTIDSLKLKGNLF